MRSRVAVAASVLLALSTLWLSQAPAQTSPGTSDEAGMPATADSPAPPDTAATTTTPVPPPQPAAQAAEAPPQPSKAAKEAKPRGPFDRGRTRASFTLGWGRSFGDDYLLLGVGLGRYIQNGLEVRLNYEAWIGSEPHVSKLSPAVNYVVRRPAASPYIGAFYTRAFISDADDLNSLGGRAGVFRGAGRSSYGLGVVYENYLDCNASTYGGDCSTIYPEAFVSTSF